MALQINAVVLDARNRLTLLIIALLPQSTGGTMSRRAAPFHGFAASACRFRPKNARAKPGADEWARLVPFG
jgi:hypothetical protein